VWLLHILEQWANYANNARRWLTFVQRNAKTLSWDHTLCVCVCVCLSCSQELAAIGLCSETLQPTYIHSGIHFKIVTPSPKQKWVPGIFPGGKGGRCVGLTTLPPSCADCLKNLGASTSWNPQGLSRPVMGLLYCFYHRPNDFLP
jgi:hypothetical protein